MAANDIRMNRGRRKERAGDIADALSNALKSNYDGLKRDCEGTYALLVETTMQHNRFTRDQAEAVIDVALRAMQSLVDREIGGRERIGALPRLAAQVASAALEVIGEAMPNGRTLQAYRNRHTDFVKELAAFAESVAYEDHRHGGFYHELGKQVAHAVLEHRKCDRCGARPLSRRARGQEAIAQACTRIEVGLPPLAWCALRRTLWRILPIRQLGSPARYPGQSAPLKLVALLLDTPLRIRAMLPASGLLLPSRPRHPHGHAQHHRRLHRCKRLDGGHMQRMPALGLAAP